MKSSWGTLLRQAARVVAARRRSNENGEETADSGFTLIELMVVLLILGILLAIAIPTFLGATKGASNKAAQSNVTTAIKAAQLVISNHSPSGLGNLTSGPFLSDLSAAEPDLNFVATTETTGTKITTIAVTWTKANGTAELADYASGTKVCWLATEGGSTGIRFGFVSLAADKNAVIHKVPFDGYK